MAMDFTPTFPSTLPRLQKEKEKPLVLNPLEAIFLQSLLDNLGGIWTFSTTAPSSYERTEEYARE